MENRPQERKGVIVSAWEKLLAKESLKTAQEILYDHDVATKLNLSETAEELFSFTFASGFLKRINYNVVTAIKNPAFQVANNFPIFKPLIAFGERMAFAGDIIADQFDKQATELSESLQSQQQTRMAYTAQVAAHKLLGVFMDAREKDQPKQILEERIGKVLADIQ